jgi:hypothetical protein
MSSRPVSFGEKLDCMTTSVWGCCSPHPFFDWWLKKYPACLTGWKNTAASVAGPSACSSVGALFALNTSWHPLDSTLEFQCLQNVDFFEIFQVTKLNTTDGNVSVKHEKCVSCWEAGLLTALYIFSYLWSFKLCSTLCQSLLKM